MRKGLMLGLAVIFLFSLTALADNKVEQKTMSGTLNCVTCDLKASNGAHSQCKIYGHNYALKLDDGSYISFMENDHSEPLIKAGEGKWLGQKVKVTGTYYPMAHMMDVQNFEVMGKNYSWCDTHKTMDQCNTDMGH